MSASYPIIPTTRPTVRDPREDESLSDFWQRLRQQLDDSYSALATRHEDAINHGTLAQRPAAGGLRRFFYATDTQTLYYDSGASWVPAWPSSLTLAVNTTNPAFSLAGAFALPTPGKITLANGANQNVVLPTTGSVFITQGPTLAYSIGGLTGGVAGRIVVLINGVAQPFTLNYLDAGSTAANRIANGTLANLLVGNNAFAAVGLWYDSVGGTWIEIFKS